MSDFEGDTSGLSPKQLVFISSVLKKEGYEDARVTIQNVGEVGDNYVANVKRIIAEKDGRSLRMVAKVAPTHEQSRATMKYHVLFYNEYVMYSRVLPKFAEIEAAAEIPASERLRYAKFYGALLEEPLELILLEDLQVPGFLLLDRFKPLPSEAIKLVLKDFAKLHSRSYALKNQEPDTYKDFCNAFVNLMLFLDEEHYYIRLYFKSLESDATNLLKSQKHKDAAQRALSKLSDITRNLHEIDSVSLHSVIQQGDGWTNNIMFRLEGTTPAECCMIDYQVARVYSPVADLTYMIFACTDYEDRAKHFHEWIDYYYSELDKNLSQFGLKADYWFPRDQLDADLKRYSEFSLANAALVASVVARQTDEAAQMKESVKSVGNDNVDRDEIMQASSMSAASDATAAVFSAKVAGAIDTLIELGCL